MRMASTDLLLERMFLARRMALRIGAVLIGLLVAMWVSEQLALLTDRGLLLLVIASFIDAGLLAVAVLVTCYYVFRAGLAELGLGYAAGHSLLCALLSGVALIGIMIVPLQVHGDIHRWREAAGE